MTIDIFDKLRRHLEERPEHILLQLVRGGERETYSCRQTVEHLTRIAQHLVQEGIEPGDRVGLLMENTPLWGLVFLGIQSAGAVAVPLDTCHDPETLARLIEHSGCRLLVSSDTFLLQVENIRRILAYHLPVLLSSRESKPGFTSLGSVLRTPVLRLELPLAPRGPEDVVVLLYTSGTTGAPKGVSLTGRNIYGNIGTALSIIKVYPDDHMLSILPLYHVLSLVINFLIPVYAGFKVTFLESLDPAKVLGTIVSERVTLFVCVPQFFYGLVRRVESEVNRQGWFRRFLFRRLLVVSQFCRVRFGLSVGRWFFRRIHARFGPAFRLFGVGGARFDRSTELFLRNLGFKLLQAYGMTETAALITVTPEEGSEPGSVGRPMPGVEVRVEQPDSEGIGQILVRGPNVMRSYWRNPEATTAALVDGWLQTGDAGYQSRSGYLYLTGRLKDIIVLSSGKNIYPEEVEHHYQMRCPEIKEMCVVGMRDEASEERREKLHAVIVPDFDYLRVRGVVNVADMVRYVVETASQMLPPFKRVKSFEIRSEPLPRTTTRKLKRFAIEKQLREKLETKSAPLAAPLQPANPPKDSFEADVFEVIRQVKKAPALSKEMNLEFDLGLDSLERVELLSNAQEKFRVHLTDAEASEIMTVGDLIAAVAARTTGTGGARREKALSWDEMLSRPLRPADAEKLHEILRPRPVAEVALRLIAITVRLIFRLLFRLRIRGTERLPKSYPFLICPNHLSYIDSVLLFAALPGGLVKRIFFLGYTDYFQEGLLARFGRMLKVIPVDPDRHLRRALRLAAEGLKEGRVLCVFPEGERSIDGALKPFRRGPAILACGFDTPVVPAVITGTYEVWARGADRIRLRPISICFGDAIRPMQGESYEDFNMRLFEAVRHLQSEQQSA